MSEVVREIEMSMDILRKKIENADLLERLSKNPDFKKFILEGFCEKHALGLLCKKPSPAYQDEKNQKYIKGQLDAVGNLKLYMQFTRQEGDMARASLKTAEEERTTAMENDEV